MLTIGMSIDANVLIFERIREEMAQFLRWYEQPGESDPILVAGLAHLRFVTIHPFDDGNGRIARAIASAEDRLESVLVKARFRERFAKEAMNERQIKMLNRVLDGFAGKLTSSKWAKLAKCSQDTAARDINNLLERGVLKKNPGGGRSTSYSLA